MRARLVPKSEEYVLNHCAKYLARHNSDARHSFFGMYDGQERGRISESWRFPIVDSHDSADADAYDWCDVTFVYRETATLESISLVSTCNRLFDPVPMRRIGDSVYWACTLKVAKAERHRYLFVMGDKLVPDPINPEAIKLPNGDVWSCFATWAFTQPRALERWECMILDRLTRHVLPFKSKEAEIFLKSGANEGNSRHLYRLYTSVGVTNYIDNVLARAERHHLNGYKTCIAMINSVLRKRAPNKEPAFMESSVYERLYAELAADGNDSSLFADGWDRSRYNSPAHFLYLLRRHAITGAFSHPKYGGNAGGMAWAYLSERYSNNAGVTAFDWRRAMEPPLGTSTEYRG